MICGKCSKNQATVHVTEVVNGTKKEAHLCEECARSAGIGMKFTFSISDILGNLMEVPKAGKGETGSLRCPECGITYSEFKAKTRLGCANDYEVFKAGLLPLLEKVHQSTQHVGKTPRTVESVVRKESELVRLKRELETVVKSENFEKAAQIRDRIKTLETELSE
ncbi:MAG: UvrB/UvrC motif-containing protein [Planctomycetes bacterium]|nr:UvrB/UvrC motif-containing protein [Planctomycetota bacterium]